MNPAKLLYIDSHGVSVTRHTLNVKKKSYPLKEIIRYRPVVVKPEKLSGTLIVFAGLILIFFGYVTTPSMVQLENTGNAHWLFNSSYVLFYLGLGTTAFGLLTILMLRKQYALQITTPEGEKCVLVSGKKEYVIKIIKSMISAFAHYS